MLTMRGCMTNTHTHAQTRLQVHQEQLKEMAKRKRERGRKKTNDDDVAHELMLELHDTITEDDVALALEQDAQV